MFKELFNVKVENLILDVVNEAIEIETSHSKWFSSEDEIARGLINGYIEYYDNTLFVWGDVV